MTAVLLEELFGHARIDSVRSLRRAVTRIAIREGADREVVSDVTLCVHEALANVVRHAYGDYPGPVEVRSSVLRTSSSSWCATWERACSLKEPERSATG